VATNAGSKAEQVGDSASLEVLARVGLIAYGVVHLLIGWLALQIAWGAASKSADSSGALRTLADQPFGKILLCLVAVGLVALALWQASAAIWGYCNHEGAKRVRKQVTSGAKAVIYAVLGGSAPLGKGAGRPRMRHPDRGRPRLRALRRAALSQGTRLANRGNECPMSSFLARHRGPWSNRRTGSYRLD
jgi:hypothetical protein